MLFSITLINQKDNSYKELDAEKYETLSLFNAIKLVLREIK